MASSQSVFRVSLFWLASVSVQGFHLQQRPWFRSAAVSIVQGHRQQQRSFFRSSTTATTTMATFTSTSNSDVVNHNFQWQQTMLRIKDPKQTVPFFEKHFGFTLLHTYNFPQWNFSLYFLAILPAGESYTLTPGTKEAEEYLWNTSLTTLELTHNHGSETDDTFRINNGNVEPYRGFGHLAVMTPDVYAACADLEAAGVSFQKKPDEGRMKGLAFCLSPEGYWIEIIRRSEHAEARAAGLKVRNTPCTIPIYF